MSTFAGPSAGSAADAGPRAVASIRAYYAAVQAAQGDEPSLRRVIDAFFADDCVQHYTGPHGGDRRGKAEIYVALSNALHSFSAIKFAEVLGAAGESASLGGGGGGGGGPRGTGTVLYTVHAQQTGPLLAGLVPPSGRPVAVPLFEVARVGADGKFVESWSSLDKFMVFAQVGIFDSLKAQFPQLVVP